MDETISNVLVGRRMTDKVGPDELARRLRALRERAGWTQMQLAERAGIAQTVISRMEGGPNLSPRLSTLRKLAEALSVSVSDLTGANGGSDARPLRGDSITLPREVFLALLRAWHNNIDPDPIDPEGDVATPEDVVAAAAMVMERESAFEAIKSEEAQPLMHSWLFAARGLRKSGQPVTADNMLRWILRWIQVEQFPQNNAMRSTFVGPLDQPKAPAEEEKTAVTSAPAEATQSGATPRLAGIEEARVNPAWKDPKDAFEPATARRAVKEPSPLRPSTTERAPLRSRTSKHSK